MYAAEAEKADEASCSGAWNWHRQRASPARNLFRPVRTIKWRELTDIQHLADGAMCSCYTAQLGGCTVVIKKPSPSSREVCPYLRCGGVMLTSCRFLFSVVFVGGGTFTLCLPLPDVLLVAVVAVE